MLVALLCVVPDMGGGFKEEQVEHQDSSSSSSSNSWACLTNAPSILTPSAGLTDARPPTIGW